MRNMNNTKKEIVELVMDLMPYFNKFKSIKYFYVPNRLSKPIFLKYNCKRESPFLWNKIRNCIGGDNPTLLFSTTTNDISIYENKNGDYDEINYTEPILIKLQILKKNLQPIFDYMEINKDYIFEEVEYE